MKLKGSNELLVEGRHDVLQSLAVSGYPPGIKAIIVRHALRAFLPTGHALPRGVALNPERAAWVTHSGPLGGLLMARLGPLVDNPTNGRVFTKQGVGNLSDPGGGEYHDP